MNLTIDIGNTKIKIGLFEETYLKSTKTFASLHELNTFLNLTKTDFSILSSVRTPYSDILKELPSLRARDPLLFISKTALPFTNQYKSSTVGLDRLAAIAGAQTLHPDSHVLSIDLGTCITYDFLEAGQIFKGGAISPGVHLRFKSMHNFTARLPLVEPKSITNCIADNTIEAMQSGVDFGIQAEIEAYIQQVKRKYPPLKTLITGGDAKFFESKIKEPIFAIPELVLVGLNAILRYNASV